MCDVVHVQPLRGRDLVWADHVANLIVEDLGRCSRQRTEPRVPQFAEVVLQREADRLRPLPDLERRERVHV